MGQSCDARPWERYILVQYRLVTLAGNGSHTSPMINRRIQKAIPLGEMLLSAACTSRLGYSRGRRLPALIRPGMRLTKAGTNVSIIAFGRSWITTQLDKHDATNIYAVDQLRVDQTAMHALARDQCAILHTELSDPSQPRQTSRTLHLAGFKNSNSRYLCLTVYHQKEDQTG
jgi:hypothetical protein